MSKYSYEFKKKVVLEYLAGKGGPVILARKYGIPSETRIKEWVKAYQNLGDEGLMRSRQKKTYSYEYKLGIVEMYLTSELSYMDIALAEKINNPCILAQWVSDFRAFGPNSTFHRLPRGKICVNLNAGKGAIFMYLMIDNYDSFV